MFLVRISINYSIKEDGLILGFLDNLQDFFLIAFAAAFGANLRFIIYKKLEEKKLSKYYIILLINTFSSFLLGLFLSLASQMSSLSDSYQLGLFFSIGIFGSLSTFSTFIYDLYDLLLHSKFPTALKLFLLSLTSGIFFFALGLLLGMK